MIAQMFIGCIVLTLLLPAGPASSSEAAPKALVRFEELNRGFVVSPELSRQHAELERELQAITAVWVDLRRQLESAGHAFGMTQTLPSDGRTASPWCPAAPSSRRPASA